MTRGKRMLQSLHSTEVGPWKRPGPGMAEQGSGWISVWWGTHPVAYFRNDHLAKQLHRGRCAGSPRGQVEYDTPDASKMLCWSNY